MLDIATYGPIVFTVSLLALCAGSVIARLRKPKCECGQTEYRRGYYVPKFCEKHDGHVVA